MNKTIRTGATGALLDEYEKAIAELKQVLNTVPDTFLEQITDPLTTDNNCRSMQTILSHVVHAGFGYATSIRNLKEPALQRPQKVFHSSVQAYVADLDHMFLFTEKVLASLEDQELETFNPEQKILSGWGQVYDREQMMEHAIVHVLRHRRQIENIKQRYNLP